MRAAHRLAAAVLLLALACRGPESPAPPVEPCQELRFHGAPAASSVVLVVNDTMRRDRLGVYGGPARTPAFDAFAREHLWFDRAVSQAPWTAPSVASLFTSLYPSQHGVTTHPRGAQGATGRAALAASDVLPDSDTTLAELLRGAGLRTAAFVSNPWMDPRFGLAQGFERYDHRFARWGAPGVALSRAALEWLEELEPGERFFLYVHTIDSHRPYGALDWQRTLGRATELREDAGRLTPEQVEELAPLLRFEGEGSERGSLLRISPALLRMAYDAGIEAFDAALGVLLEGLRAHPAWPQMAVIVTSDHGEALYERGYGNHGHGLFDDELAIPLAARLPGVEPVGELPVSCAVGLVDVLPTLCGYLGLRCPSPIAGSSWLPGGPGREPRYLVSEGVMERPAHRALRTRRWKLLAEPEGGPDGRIKRQAYSLYDLEADPQESLDLLEQEAPRPEHRRVAEILGAALDLSVQQLERPERRAAPLDAELSRRLRELGYLGDEPAAPD